MRLSLLAISAQHGQNAKRRLTGSLARVPSIDLCSFVLWLNFYGKEFLWRVKVSRKFQSFQKAKPKLPGTLLLFSQNHANGPQTSSSRKASAMRLTICEGMMGSLTLLSHFHSRHHGGTPRTKLWLFSALASSEHSNQLQLHSSVSSSECWELGAKRWRWTANMSGAPFQSSSRFGIGRHRISIDGQTYWLLYVNLGSTNIWNNLDVSITTWAWMRLSPYLKSPSCSNLSISKAMLVKSLALTHNGCDTIRQRWTTGTSTSFIEMKFLLKTMVTFHHSTVDYTEKMRTPSNLQGTL